MTERERGTENKYSNKCMYNISGEDNVIVKIKLMEEAFGSPASSTPQKVSNAVQRPTVMHL